MNNFNKMSFSKIFDSYINDINNSLSKLDESSSPLYILSLHANLLSKAINSFLDKLILNSSKFTYIDQNKLNFIHDSLNQNNRFCKDIIREINKIDLAKQLDSDLENRIHNAKEDIRLFLEQNYPQMNNQEIEIEIEKELNQDKIFKIHNNKTRIHVQNLINSIYIIRTTQNTSHNQKFLADIKQFNENLQEKCISLNQQLTDKQNILFKQIDDCFEDSKFPDIYT